MKKILVLTAALFIAFSSHARIGIVGGLTAPSSNLQSTYLRYVNQYHFGLTWKMQLGEIIDVQPSLIYNVKGTTFTNAADDVSSFEFDDLKTGFIELPVQFQAGVTIGDLTRVYGLAEPFIGYAVANFLDGESDKNWKYVKNRLEYGIGLGAGVDIFTHLQINLKYIWNFGQLYEFDFEDVSEGLSGNANGIRLSIALLF